ncbi:MAG TPA: nucleotidyltransferase [Candidatus Dormibacteraeota bacterium]|nr:nucleotidyltransferase [Candidatus Dormibacteraeota bacterium]
MAPSEWERTFRGWTGPSSDTEQEKCANAERAVKSAIKASATLARRNVSVFTQGSYRNNTNVKIESDVDICVLCTDTIDLDFTFGKGLDLAAVGLEPATYAYADFKSEVEAALVAHFGKAAVHRGDKAFDIHENSYRVDADVVACFEHRRYTGTADRFSAIKGTAFRPDSGGLILNWPDQHYANGVKKNDATSRRFKQLVRIVKRLRYYMEEQGVAAAKGIPSYLVECLVWNVPNGDFGHSNYVADIRHVLAHLYNNTTSDEGCGEWGEVNELKYLFRPWQPWSRQQAHAFVDAAWDFIGFS